MSEKKMKKIGPIISADVETALVAAGYRTANHAAQTMLPAIVELFKTPVTKTFKRPFEGVDYAVRTFSGMYRNSLASLKGKFTIGELNLMFEALMGVWLTPGMAGQHIQADVAQIIDFDDAEKRHMVDGNALKQKLSCLQLAELASLEIWLKHSDDILRLSKESV